MSGLDGEGVDAKSSALVNGKGWDGKLRVEKRAVISQSDTLSDAEKTEDDPVPVEQIVADEGITIFMGQPDLHRY